MRSFKIAVFVQVVLASYVASTSSFDSSDDSTISQLSVNGIIEFSEDEIADLIRNVVGDRSSARILAANWNQIQKDVAKTAVQLDHLVTSMQNMSSEIGDLTQTLTSTETEVLTKLTNISTSVTDGSVLATKLDATDTTLTKVVEALINRTDNSTILSEFSELINLMETKMTNLEKILGYDNYPTTTAGPTTTTGSSIGR